MVSDGVFVDTSAFKALMDPKDYFNSAVLPIWERLLKEEVLLITTNFVIDETLTLLRVKSGFKIAVSFKEDLLRSVHSLKIGRVLVRDEVAAWSWFIKEWSGLSFTDCTSFAVMKRMGLEKVATFDQHFQKAGFEIVK